MSKISAAVAFVAMFVLSSAQAFSGSVSLGTSVNPDKDKNSQVAGLSMNHPLFLGFGWWSWTGAGQSYSPSKGSSEWGQTVQGLDWTVGNFKVGVSAKFELENEFQDLTSEYGAKVSIKLW